MKKTKKSGKARSATYKRRRTSGKHALTGSRVAHVIAKMRSEGLSLHAASRHVGISPKTVQRWGKTALRRNKAGRYTAKRTDRLIRFLVIPSARGPREIAVRNSAQATVASRYSAAVKLYLQTGDSSELRQFKGKFLTEVSGKQVPLLTDLAELDQLGSAGTLSFESIYSRT